MKKLIVLLSIVILFVTGCSVTKLDNTDIGKNMKTLLSKKTSMYNVYYDGYKYYLPKGITFVDKEDYNAILRDQNNNKYYLYVDAISYYHKTENDYEVDNDAHYSKKISYNKKTGYIQIDEVDSKYFIQFVFNYVKMEAYVDKKYLTDAVDNMCYILRSVKFNDAVLESLIGENILDYMEEDYSLFKADSSKEDFLDVVEREETDAYKKDLEDEKIDLDE
jgi:Mor family transcriptional regulator